MHLLGKVASRTIDKSNGKRLHCLLHRLLDAAALGIASRPIKDQEKTPSPMAEPIYYGGSDPDHAILFKAVYKSMTT
jgi:hypothetical protein